MSEGLHYKGYDGSVEYSAKDRILHGRIVGIRDRVTFEGETVSTLEASFRSAVDEYLAFCAEQNKQPDQPFSGSFNVRAGADLHRRAVLYAEQNHLKLNAVVRKALESYLPQP